jgi:two-component system, cell cycle response regulator CpdR
MNTHVAPRILLAEDEEAMRTYLARALTNAGYEVSAVDSGVAAVPLLENGDFDLLLSDIVMPEMDGIELAQHCAEISPRTKVMFITGFAAVTFAPAASSHLPRCCPSPSTCAIWCSKWNACSMTRVRSFLIPDRAIACVAGALGLRARSARERAVCSMVGV